MVFYLCDRIRVGQCNGRTTGIVIVDCTIKKIVNIIKFIMIYR